MSCIINKDDVHNAPVELVAGVEAFTVFVIDENFSQGLSDEERVFIAEKVTPTHYLLWVGWLLTWHGES